MALKVGELVAHIRADTRGLRTGLRTAHRELQSLRGEFGKVGGGALSFAMLAAKATVGAAGLAAAVGAGAVAVVGLASAVAGALPLLFSFGAALVQAAGSAALIPGALAAVAAVVGVVKLGMIGLGDAMKAVAEDDAEKLNEALKRLAPNARAFVKQAHALRPAFERLRLGVQNRLFAQTAALLKALAVSTMPTLTVGANKLAEALNRGVVAALADLNTKANQSTLATVLGSAARMVDNLTSALRPAGQALLDVLGVGAQITAQLSAGVGATIGALAQRISEMAASGELKTMILDGLSALRDLWGVGRNLLGIFRGLGSAIGMDTGKGLFGILDQLNKAINSAAGQAALTKIFEELGRIGVALTPVLISVLQALVPVAKGVAQIAVAFAPTIAVLAEKLGPALASLVPGFLALAPLVGTLATGLAPLASILVGLVTGMAPGANSFLVGLVEALRALAPAAPAVGHALGEILRAVAPLLPVLGVELARILIALAPLITEWMRALTPAVPMIAELVRVGGQLVAFLLRSPVAMHLATSSTAMLVSQLRIAMGVLGFLADAVGFVIRLFRVDAPRAIEGFGSTVRTTLMGFGSLLFDAGRNLVSGLWRGIQSMSTTLRSNLTSWARENIPGPIAKVLGIGSPSRVMAEQVGKWIPLGIVQGIRSQIPTLRDAMAGLGGGMSSMQLAGAGGGRTTNVTVTVKDGALGFLADFIDVTVDDRDDATATAARGGTRF